MNRILDRTELETLIARIDRLESDAAPRWGRMTVHQMVCHMCDYASVALGELPTRPIPGPMRYPGVKQLLICVVPWPKGRVRSPPEGFTTPPEEWERDRNRMRELLRRLARKDVNSEWPPHPLFGRMSGRLWAALTRRHFDHHLTQFGV